MLGIRTNPLIRLEFLRRFRSGVAAWGIPLLTVIPGLAVVIAYATGTSSFVTRSVVIGVGANGAVGGIPNPGGPGGGVNLPDGNLVSANQVASFGTPMFVVLFIAVVATLMILIPAIVGGSVSSERANQTLQPLQLTALKPTDIVMGKLVSSLAYLLLLLVCLAPVFVIPFLVGGVPMGTLLRACGLLFLVTVELAAISLAVSSIVTKPVGSIVVSILVSGLVVIGPFVAMGIAFYGQVDPSVRFDWETSTRLLGAVSPVSLFSLIGNTGSIASGKIAGGGVQVSSVGWLVLITLGALAIARRNVTAPVVKDR